MKDRFRVRAWNEIGKYYLYDVQNSIYSHNRQRYTFVDAVNKGLLKKWKLEQCTGLRDKYGKLMYEGDIIRGVWKDVKIKYVVKFHKCNAQFILEIPNEDSLGEFDLLESDHLEIIGNIHKNFELLEVE